YHFTVGYVSLGRKLEQERYRYPTWNSGNWLRWTRRMGCSILQRAGLHRHGRQLRCDSHESMGHDHRRARSTQLAAWPAQPAVRRQLSSLHLADVGILPESRLLSVHQRIHDANGYQRRYRVGVSQLPAGIAGGEAATGRYSADAVTAVVRRRLCPGRLPDHAYDNGRDGVAL